MIKTQTSVSSHSMNVSSKSTNETWQDIQRVVESLSARSRETLPPEQFYNELVAAMVQLVSASDCNWWQATQPMHPGSTELALPDGVESVWRQSASTMNAALASDHRSARSATLRSLADRADSSSSHFFRAGQKVGTASDVSLDHDTLFHVVIDQQDCVGVLELVFDDGASADQREAAEHLSEVVGELATDFDHSWKLRQLRDKESRRERLDRFLDSIHRSYDLQQVAHAIVEDGKELLGCDRLILVKNSGRKCQLLAISGVQKPDRRSPTVQLVEKISRSKRRESESIWFDRQALSDSDIQDYVDESNVANMGVLPLLSLKVGNTPPQRIGTLLVESFSACDPSSIASLQTRSEWLVRHASNALGNASEISRLPLLNVVRWVDRNVTRGKRIPWLAILMLPIMLAAYWLAMKPTAFEIEARGELVPVQRESIYAPRNASVIEFPIAESNKNVRQQTKAISVRPGDVVVRLEDAQLDYELTSLLGEQSTIDQQLDTVKASLSRLGGSRDAESRKRYDDLTAQAAELQVKQKSLERQIKLIRKERDRLEVSASIPGEILKWNLVRDLKLRPVKQGDFLFEVVDVDGEWEVELYVRDRHVGYVTKANDSQQEPLEITFFHRSNPEQHFPATVKTIGLSTELYPEYGSAVRVTGHIDAPETLPTLRPGTTLVAKIGCGEKPLIYVLTYDLIHTIRMWGLF